MILCLLLVLVAAVSLLVQNTLVAICSVVLAVAFHDKFAISYCNKVSLFFLVACVVVITGSLANLATVANTISIERDWVVVIADKNKNTLASKLFGLHWRLFNMHNFTALNACMRRIDLCCKLMAPVLIGAVITYTNYFTSTLFVAGWNVISYFAEFSLLCIVYYYVPTLAHKKYRKSTVLAVSSEDQAEDGAEEVQVVSEKATSDVNEADDDNDNDDSVFVVGAPKSKSCKRRCVKVLSKLITPYTTIRDGWKIYAKQEIARVGIAMSLLYVTVLGFHGVTAAYFKTQGLTEVLIGVFQGVGGIIAIIGTFVYVPLRKKVGTVRAGLFGMCTQFFMLLFCVAGVFAPGNSIETKTGGDYFSPYCPVSLPVSSSHSNSTVVTITPSQTSATSLPSIIITSTYLMSTTVTPMPTPLPTEYTNSRTPVSLYSVPTYSHSYSINPNSNNSAGMNDSEDSLKHAFTISLILLLVGVLGARFGLWMFDLSVSQLVQEKVKEEERGVVSGVMNVFIANSDMLHYLLVIVAPDPKYFGILTIISVSFVGCGLLLYASYVHKVRGHLFHFSDTYQRIKSDLKCYDQSEYTRNLVSDHDNDEGIEVDNPDQSEETNM